MNVTFKPSTWPMYIYIILETTCAPDSSNKYAGNQGALDCLRDVGDFAAITKQGKLIGLSILSSNKVHSVSVKTISKLLAKSNSKFNIMMEE